MIGLLIVESVFGFFLITIWSEPNILRDSVVVFVIIDILGTWFSYELVRFAYEPVLVVTTHGH